MFGRRRHHDAEPVEDEALETGAADAEPAEEDLGAPETDDGAEQGPWDVSDAPDDELPRVDLGSLQVPTLPGVEIRLDASPTGEVVAVTLIAGASALQLGAFAAPRSEGIWNEVRGEIFEALRSQGGTVHEQDGPFGPELAAKVPTAEGKQDARFVGVNGPRWFVRGVFTGPAATNPQQAEVLEQSLRAVVVARGGEAMPVRDPLPLAIPPEVLEEQAGDEGNRPPPPLPERGPEITETR